VRERINWAGVLLTLLCVVGTALWPVPQTVAEHRTAPAVRPDRPMLACWDNGCRIVIVDYVGDVENERPDRVMVRWPAEDGDGDSWHHGWTVRDRLRPLE
jgi:hypothetical protein